MNIATRSFVTHMRFLHKPTQRCFVTFGSVKLASEDTLPSDLSMARWLLYRLVKEPGSENLTAQLRPSNYVIVGSYGDFDGSTELLMNEPEERQSRHPRYNRLQRVSSKQLSFPVQGGDTCTNCSAIIWRHLTDFDKKMGFPQFSWCIPGAIKQSKVKNSRIEVLCSRCNGHFGYIRPKFENGNNTKRASVS